MMHCNNTMLQRSTAVRSGPYLAGREPTNSWCMTGPNAGPREL